MSVLITLKKLHTEGRLSIGDTLHHSETGDHELVGVIDSKRLRVKDSQGVYHLWEIDFGPDARIVQRISNGNFSSPANRSRSGKAERD